MHANDPSPWAVDVCDEQNRNGHDNRHDQKEERTSSPLAVAEEHITRDCDKAHQSPRRRWYAIPPGSLCTTLRVEHIVHAGDGERGDRRGISVRRWNDRRPEFRLQLLRFRLNLPDVALAFALIELDPLIEPLPDEVADGQSASSVKRFGRPRDTTFPATIRQADTSAQRPLRP